jgi:hypothetical protein
MTRSAKNKKKKGPTNLRYPKTEGSASGHRPNRLLSVQNPLQSVAEVRMQHRMKRIKITYSLLIKWLEYSFRVTLHKTCFTTSSITNHQDLEVQMLRLQQYNND